MARSKGFRLTERDAELVAFTARFHGVEAAQLAQRFGMDRADVYHRAARLAERGLLERHRLLHARPGVYTATSAGLAWVESSLPPARPSLHAYDHSLELTWLALALEEEFGREPVLSEREVRSLEMPAAWDAHRTGQRLRPRYALLTERNGAPRGLHFPDLVVEAGAPRGGLLAIELELTAKGGARRRRIIRAYRDSLQIEQVRYYATPTPLALLERTVAVERANEVAPVFDLRAYAPRVAR
jgi:DNA-binding MarR family transcriptional regulator